MESNFSFNGINKGKKKKGTFESKKYLNFNSNNLDKNKEVT